MSWSAACFVQSWVDHAKTWLQDAPPPPNRFYSFSYPPSSFFLYFKAKWRAEGGKTYVTSFTIYRYVIFWKFVNAIGTENIYFSVYHFTGLLIYVLRVWIFADIYNSDYRTVWKVMVRLSWGRVYRPCYDRHAQSWLSCSCPPKLWITSYHYFY